MKQKDILLVIVVIFISGIISYVLSNTLISSPKNRHQTVEVVDKITSDFPQPPTKYFNKDANDPTKLIQIGNNNNPAPFNGTE